MYQVAIMTREEKVAMYSKLSKKEIIELLLNNQDIVEKLTKTQVYIPWQGDNGVSTTRPYHEICSCNPKNGGSGICNCTLGNTHIIT